MPATSKILECTWNRLKAHYSKPTPNGAWSRAYRRILGNYYRFLIPSGSRLLEIGCGSGELLQHLTERKVAGIDLVEQQISAAKLLLPDAEFTCAAGETATFSQTYDYFILSDTLNEAADAQQLLQNLHHAATSETRLVLNIHNTLWRPILGLSAALGLKPKRPQQNWLSTDDLNNLLDLAGWEMVRSDARILIPHELGGLGSLINKFIAPLVPFACLSLFFVARPKQAAVPAESLTVSVIIPARNEKGNIEAAIQRTPDMGKSTEIIFVEGNSQDDTWDTIQAAIKNHPERSIKACQQPGKGKGDAMRLGYEKATGDIIMILDADLTVPPEDLPKFFDAIQLGHCEFVNGVRLVYPMEDEAMRFLNMCGNKFFSMLFSWLLSIPIKDTLCGTKVFSKTHYELIEANRSYFGNFDPFGDFDLIFGAAKLNLKIRDLPIRYQSRTYGEPQIDRWRDGMLLIRMAIFAARKIKFL
ncbi:MAG: SAM-dependent methyltransferase [Lentimonas sp.]|jgi:SAM-dependent methyltransferase